MTDEHRSIEHQYLDLQYICDDQDKQIKELKNDLKWGQIGSFAVGLLAGYAFFMFVTAIVGGFE